MELNSLDSVFQSTDNHICLLTVIFVVSCDCQERMQIQSELTNIRWYSQLGVGS